MDCSHSPTKEFAQFCVTERENELRGYQQVDERIARFRAYLSPKMADPQSAAPLTFATNQGEKDIARVMDLPCATPQCLEDYIKQNPDEAATIERRRRCDGVSAQLPF
jgi:hypothetical protein